MRKMNFFKSAVITAIALLSITTVKAQLYYENSHLFVGQKPQEYTNVGPNPGYYVGPNFGIEFFENGLNIWRPYPLPNSGNFKLFLDENGRLGIGRKPTTYKLEVEGQVWTTAGLLITSDETLKRNIRNMSDTRNDYVSKLLRINGKSYEKQIQSGKDNAREVEKMAKQ